MLLAISERVWYSLITLKLIRRIPLRMRAGLFTTLVIALSFPVAAATFGTVVVIGGHASDLALDNQRGKLYIANFAGRRIDVMSTSNNTLGTPISLTTVGEAGSLALSPDSRYLVVTNYADCSTGTPPAPCTFLTSASTPQLTIIDLVANTQTVLPIPQPTPATAQLNVPLAVAFGQGSQAFLVTSSGLFLVDPVAGTFQQLPGPQVTITSKPLPVAFGTFPPQIIQASSTVSGDGQTIFVLAQGTQPQPATATTPAVAGNQILIIYNVASGTLGAATIVSNPALGPRTVSANFDGSDVLAAWSLLNQQFVQLAQFPYPTGVLNLGGTAWDYSRNVIYAQIPSAGASAPVLHLVDTDNLTVRERIQLPENLGGRTVFSSDMNTLYAISDSGVTVFPIGSFATAHRVSTLEEQLLFETTNCDNGLISQTLDVVDLGGGNTDFTLSVPTTTQGITFSPTSGTTPAKVTVTVDPTAFSATGTTAIPVTIQSNGSIGIPNTVRLLINKKDPGQRGVIHSLAGTIVDLAADPFRGRIYALRQDRNQVIVMDGNTFNTITTLRTGNTPTKMTFTRDGKYMIVGNDNSQIANAFDLDTLQPSQPIVFIPGHYPRSIAASNSTMFAVVRNAGSPAGLIDQVDFTNRVGSTPASLGIFLDNVNPDSVMTASPSGNYIFTASADGTVLLYDDPYSAFEASRQDLKALGGSYAAVSDNVFLAGGVLFNQSMVEIGPLAGATATSSVLISGNDALTVNPDSTGASGIFDRVFALTAAAPTVKSLEAPVTKATLTTPSVGQIGQTILSFLETMATSSNGSILYLSTSGFTELPVGFDQPTPVPVIFSVGNSANGGAVAPGSLIAIGGSSLSSTAAYATQLPLPTSLGEICVAADGTSVPLLLVSPTEIDAQLPYEVSGAVNLVISAPGGQSAPFSFNAPPTAIAVFVNGQAGDFSGLPKIFRAANNELVDFTNPIRPDDTLMIYATGLGQTAPSAVSGAAAPFSPLEIALEVPIVTLGAAQLNVNYAGLVPGLVGLYQINAVVPHKLSSGSQVPLTIALDTSSTTFMVRVVSP